MKPPILLLLVLLGLGIIPARAQSWCPPGAEWHYTAAFCQGGCTGNVHMAAAGDTLIQNEPCTRIERIRTYTAYFNPTIHTDTLTELYTYSAAGIVWMFDPQLNAFDTLYDFNASPGDSWQLIHLPEGSSGSDFLTVLDTGHVGIDGQQLRWLSVEYHFQAASGNNPSYLDTLIERIGSNTYYMLPYDFPNGFVDGQEGGFFRCYTDHEISYQSPSVQTCELPLGIAERTERTTATLFPNPGTDQLTIEVKGGEVQEVLVRDALGRIRLRAEGIMRQRVVLNATGFPPGCYAIEVRSGRGNLVQRWIKQ